MCIRDSFPAIYLIITLITPFSKAIGGFQSDLMMSVTGCHWKVTKDVVDVIASMLLYVLKIL